MSRFHAAISNCIGNQYKYRTDELKKCIEEDIDNIDKKDEAGLTAFHHAARNNLHECVDELLNAGANTSILDSDGHTALHLFTFHSGWKPNQSPIDLDMILYRPLSHQENLVLEALINRVKLNVNDQDNRGNTALHYAYIHSCPLCIEFLINNGADTQIANKRGMHPEDYPE